MDVRVVAAFFVALLPMKNVDVDLNDKELQMKKQRDQKLQLEKNSRMYHLKVGLSPNSVLGAVSGSLLRHTLIFFVIFLHIQSCGGDEVSDTRPKADPSTLSFSTPHAILIGVLTVLCAISAIVCCTKKHAGRTKEVSKSPEDPPPPLTQEKLDIYLHTLTEQKTEIKNLKDDLLSQLEEVDRQKTENREKLQIVENGLEEKTGDNKQELLREKRNLLESKWKLDEAKTEKEKVLLQTEKLLQTLDTVVEILRIH